MSEVCDHCGKSILTTIFRGSGYCSDNCRRSLGLHIRGEKPAAN